jgi:ligand-binding sensor domain-containing protein
MVSLPPFSLVECQDGSLIAGTARGLARFQGGVWKDATREWNFPGKQARKAYAGQAGVSMVFVDRAGTLWVVTETRVIFYFPFGQKQFIDPADPLDVTGTASNFVEAPDGAIWISEGRRSAHTVRRSEDHSPMTEVRGGASWVLFDRDGGLWVGSPDDGLRRIAHPDRIRGHQIAQFGPEAEQFTTNNGFSGDYVYALFEDREGNIWSGTSHGLDRFRERPFTSIPILQPGMPRGILGTSDGSLWTFAWNEKIARISPRGDQEVMSRYGATSMFEDESGVLWLADQEPINVSRFQQGRFISVVGPEPPLPGIPTRFFHAIRSEHPLPGGES